MRKTIIFFSLLLFILPVRGTAKGDVYFSWMVGASYLAHPTSDQQLVVSFPYSVTDAAGNVSQHMFISSAIRPYSKHVGMASPLKFELGKPGWFVPFELHFGRSGFTQFSTGYGRNFYFDYPGKDKRSIYDRSLVLKASVSAGLINYTHAPGKGAYHLGTINNYNDTINLQGMSSGPTYQIGGSDDVSTTTETDSTRSLDIYYVQREFVIIPRISISNNHYKHLLHWEFSVSYNIPFSDESGIKFMQNNEEPLDGLNISPINSSTNHIIASYNGKTITSAPYRFSGIMFGASVGISFSSHNRHKKKPGDTVLMINENAAQ